MERLLYTAGTTTAAFLLATCGTILGTLAAFSLFGTKLGSEGWKVYASIISLYCFFNAIAELSHDGRSQLPSAGVLLGGQSTSQATNFGSAPINCRLQKYVYKIMTPSLCSYFCIAQPFVSPISSGLHDGRQFRHGNLPLCHIGNTSRVDLAACPAGPVHPECWCAWHLFFAKSPCISAGP